MKSNAREEDHRQLVYVRLATYKEDVIAGRGGDC
jgi:hypothetical protein